MYKISIIAAGLVCFGSDAVWTVSDDLNPEECNIIHLRGKARGNEQGK